MRTYLPEPHKARRGGPRDRPPARSGPGGGLPEATGIPSPLLPLEIRCDLTRGNLHQGTCGSDSNGTRFDNTVVVQPLVSVGALPIDVMWMLMIRIYSKG
jgi:hypothetical protein